MGFDFERLCKAMFWEKYSKDETWESVAERNEANSKNYPNNELINVVYYGGVEKWSLHQKVESFEDLETKIFKLFRLASTNEILKTKYLQEIYPLIYNFCVYASGIDRRGKTLIESERLAGASWWGELAKKILKEKTDEIFSVKPCKEKYKESAQKLKEIWQFSDVEIDAFRYFICQTRQENFNPSLNKSLYLWSGKKQTGKTSVARAIASILNGGKNVLDGAKFESSFNVEMQMGAHDLPASCKYNCVILDEAMPKDSRKSYGRVKSMLTSNNVTYNQKWGAVISLLAKRFYIFTSNDDISDFIQDDSERRLIQIKMDKKPIQISFEEIYNVWKNFAQNCSPESDWQSWYNSFSHVDGLERKDIEIFKSEIITNDSILRAIESRSDFHLTLRFFEDILIVGKTTRDERTALKKALVELFGKSNRTDGWRWSKSQLLEKLKNLRSEDVATSTFSDVLDETTGDKLPF